MEEIEFDLHNEAIEAVATLGKIRQISNVIQALENLMIQSEGMEPVESVSRGLLVETMEMLRREIHKA